MRTFFSHLNFSQTCNINLWIDNETVSNITIQHQRNTIKTAKIYKIQVEYANQLE